MRSMNRTERCYMKKIHITDSSMTEAMAQIDLLEHLSPKDQNCLRLLAEEMFSMCNELLHTHRLNFEMENEKTSFMLRVSTKTNVDDNAREAFMSMSSSGKNEANKGVKGMLGAVLELMFVQGSYEYAPSSWSYGIHPGSDGYSCMWTLSQFMDQAPRDKAKNEWDGMEKSIIANFADDVTIGVRSGRLEMTVTKVF